jgi:hypothetical protein
MLHYFYYDIEEEKFLTIDDLRKEFEVLTVNGATDCKNIEEYVKNCTSKNGTLLCGLELKRYMDAIDEE